jgi:hypothetical protein
LAVELIIHASVYSISFGFSSRTRASLPGAWKRPNLRIERVASPAPLNKRRMTRVKPSPIEIARHIPMSRAGRSNLKRKFDCEECQMPRHCLGSMTSDEAFLEQFEAGLVPLEQWHHEQHIKVAYLYLRRHPFETAVAAVREKIKAHNLAHKVPESPTGGYHETMTQAWMRLVYLTLCEYGPAESADAFYKNSPQLSEKKILRLFYSREVFMSPQAKIEYLEPDLAPLPRSPRQAPPIIGQK